jgi:hypothetical protein
LNMDRSKEFSFLQNAQTFSLIQPPIQWILGSKATRKVVFHHSPPRNTEFINEWSYTSISTLRFMALTGSILLLPQFLYFYLSVLGISLLRGRLTEFSLLYSLKSYKTQFSSLAFCRFFIMAL